MAPLTRDFMLRVRMTEDERKMLETLAARQGLTSSDVVRQLVRREHEVTVRAAPRKRPKPKK
jgi:hypothetical protein